MDAPLDDGRPAAGGERIPAAAAGAGAAPPPGDAGSALASLRSDLADACGLLVCGLDADGVIEIASPSCARLTRLPLRALPGRPWLDTFVPDERRLTVLELWRRIGLGQTVGPYEGTGRQRRWIRWQFSPWARADGRPGIGAVGLDLSSERIAQARAHETEHAAALGTLSAGLAHEIRNPLNGASLQLALALRRLARLPGLQAAPTAEAVTRAAGEIRRAADLLDDFLAFARPRAPAMAPVELRSIAVAARAKVLAAAGPTAVAIAIEPGPPVDAEADPALIEEALCALLRNAIEAVREAPSGDAVRLRVNARDHFATIEVEDHGPGLPSPDAPIFDPFFTTKPGGTGLGLAIVRRIASDHRGRAEVERRLGATVFSLTLPLPEGPDG